MSFEKLPNVLIVKIFKYILFGDSDGSEGELIDWQALKEDIPRLRLVCKRFNAIINHELQESLDWNNRFPTFYIDPYGPNADHPSVPEGLCDLIYCEGQCRHIRAVARFKHIKFGKLYFNSATLSGCIARSFKEHSSYFSNVTQLIIYSCRIDLSIFDMIIRSLPNFKGLVINCARADTHEYEPLDDKERTSLMLNKLIIGDCCCDQIYEYVIRFLPARHIIFEPDHYQQAVNREWADRYLIRHKDVVETSFIKRCGYLNSCRFPFC